MPGSVHVGFVVDKAAVGQVFSKFFSFSLSVLFHHGSPDSYNTWGLYNRPVCPQFRDIVSPHQREQQQPKS
jgi:pimeloyl-ACP methyl ester carboxylesterase